jgi:hypothetical protein
MPDGGYDFPTPEDAKALSAVFFFYYYYLFYEQNYFLSNIFIIPHIIKILFIYKRQISYLPLHFSQNFNTVPNERQERRRRN